MEENYTSALLLLFSLWHVNLKVNGFSWSSASRPRTPPGAPDLPPPPADRSRCPHKSIRKDLKDSCSCIFHACSFIFIHVSLSFNPFPIFFLTSFFFPTEICYAFLRCALPAGRPISRGLPRVLPSAPPLILYPCFLSKSAPSFTSSPFSRLHFNYIMLACHLL